MQSLLPPTIATLRVCQLAVLEENPATSSKIIFVVALSWIILGPLFVFIGFRNQWALRSIILYACGAVVSVGAIMALTWHWAVSCSDQQRIILLSTNIGLPFLACGAAIALLASFLGILTRRGASTG